MENTLTLEQMFEMQKELDAKIVREKGLEGKDLIPNTVLALQVELGELANEWRGFKHWSKDQEPRTRKIRILGVDDIGVERGEYYNPLLEEYVDCVHFFLSIARQRGWTSDVLRFYVDALEESKEEGLQGGVTGAFLEVNYWLVKSHLERGRDEKIEQKLGWTKQEAEFRNAWYIFNLIGEIAFGFDFDTVAEAYAKKNAVNHERQANGY